LGLGP
jgi:hypothetical protein